MALAMVNERLPGGPVLAVAAAQLGKIVPAMGKAQFLAKSFKVLSCV
jgi:hypothetical protein